MSDSRIDLTLEAELIDVLEDRIGQIMLMHRGTDC